MIGDEKELQLRDDGVFVHSLKQPEKNLLLTYNRFIFVYVLYFITLYNFKSCFLYSLLTTGSLILSLLCVHFSWTYLKSVLADIDNEACELNRKTRPVKYRTHLGHNIFVSVTDGYMCVDLRQFYLPYGMEYGAEKPTKRGIALRLSEWGQLLKLIGEIESSRLDSVITLPSNTSVDRPTQMGMLDTCDCSNAFHHMKWN